MGQELEHLEAAIEEYSDWLCSSEWVLEVLTHRVPGNFGFNFDDGHLPPRTAFISPANLAHCARRSHDEEIAIKDSGDAATGPPRHIQAL